MKDEKVIIALVSSILIEIAQEVVKYMIEKEKEE